MHRFWTSVLAHKELKDLKRSSGLDHTTEPLVFVSTICDSSSSKIFDSILDTREKTRINWCVLKESQTGVMNQHELLLSLIVTWFLIYVHLFITFLTVYKMIRIFSFDKHFALVNVLHTWGGYHRILIVVVMFLLSSTQNDIAYSPNDWHMFIDWSHQLHWYLSLNVHPTCQ